MTSEQIRKSRVPFSSAGTSTMSRRGSSWKNVFRYPRAAASPSPSGSQSLRPIPTMSGRRGNEASARLLAEERRREHVDEAPEPDARAAPTAGGSLAGELRAGDDRPAGADVAGERNPWIQARQVTLVDGVTGRSSNRRQTALEDAWRRDLPDIVLFGIVPWSDRWQRPHHLAAELAGRGHRVVYVTPHLLLGGRALARARVRVVSRRRRRSPSWRPTRGTRFTETSDWEADDVSHAHHTFWRMVDELRLRCPILLVESPVLVAAALVGLGSEPTSRSSTTASTSTPAGTPRLPSWSAAWEEELAASSNLVLASAVALEERMRAATDDVQSRSERLRRRALP